MKLSNETKVGVLATISIVLLVLGYNLMRGKNIFTRDKIYYVRYDNAGGLAPAGHVRYKGMNVGHVLDIQLANDQSGKIEVSIAVMRDLKIPVGSEATVFSPDFISAKAINIEFSDASNYLASGDTLVPGYSSNGFQAVQSQAEALIVSLDSAINSISSVFDSETRSNLQKSIKSIESTLSYLDQSAATVDAMVSKNASRLERIFINIESITGNLSDNQDEINEILNNLTAISDTLKRAQFAATINEAREVLQQSSEVINKINSGQGSMGLLINDDSLYNNLEASSKSLDSLLVDIKAHPSRYVHVSVFGKKDKEPKDKGEK